MMAIDSRLRLLIGGVTLVAGSAFAQTPNATPTPTVPPDSVPGQIEPGEAKPTAPAQNLSEKLNQSNGVIHPKEVDPAIEKPVPKTRDPNVVPLPHRSQNERRFLRFLQRQTGPIRP
jgi:hypothetical protein